MEYRQLIINNITYNVYDNGVIMSKGKLLKPFINKDGYLRIRLGGRAGKLHLVHRVIASTFITNAMSKPTVNHKDGNKVNNHVKNLEWATFGENMAHSYSSGLRKSYNSLKNRGK